MSESQNNTTIKILAERLGLSKGTVSKALKDSYEISKATKTKVLKAARELNYIPNHFASGLKSKKSKTIAVIVPEIVDSFFSSAINGIEAATQKKGYHINIYITNDLLSKEQEIMRVLSDGRVDGVLMSMSRETSSNGHVKKLIDQGIPLVFFDRVADELETSKVVTNDFEGGYLATRHLIDQNCGKIFFLSVSESLPMLQNRMEGFLQACEEDKRSETRKNIVQVSTDESKSLGAIKSLFARADERPDGLVISVELLTFPVYNACRELGITIPDELKIVCFSNLLYASLLSPPLSTITQPAFEMGQQAANLICNAIDKKITLKNEKIICPSKLDIRQSSMIAS